MRRLVKVALFVGLATTGLVLAQFPQAPQDQNGPPPNGQNPNDPNQDQGQPQDDQSRAVGRISVVNGDVSMRLGDSGEVVAAALNAPVVVQDQVMTNEGSRAEVQLDASNMIRLSPLSEIRLSDLEYNRYQIQIARGTVTFRVLHDQTADVELSTPTVSVRPVGRGVYRVTVRDDGTTEITVRAGDADIFTPRGSERLSAGRTMVARGTPADPEVQVVAAIRPDEWDQWNERRDADLERSQSRQYVASDIYGTEDLDNNGRWVNDTEFGNVWTPYATAGWAPYRNGRWTWVDYYGWSWVSYDPWGWAPYHYGRWFYRSSFGWAWYPGERHNRHYWSPALVAFFGVGGGGVGVGFGHVGWVPLGPHEPYYRGYGRGVYGGYRNGLYTDRNVSIVNNVNISSVYRNARVNNGITAIDREQFGRGRVNNNFRVSAQDLNRATLVRGQLPVAPGRESLRVSDREVRNVRSFSDNTRFSSRRPAAQVDRIPFEQQRRGMEQISRRSLGETPGQTGRGSSDPGGRRFGEPVRGGATQNNGAGGRPADRQQIDRQQLDLNRRNSGQQQQPRRNLEAAPRPTEQRPVESRPPEQRYQAQPRTETPRTDSNRPRGNEIRISPPIVRERAVQEQRSAPPRQEPRQQQHVERSAPRSEPRSESRGNGAGGGGHHEDSGGRGRGK